MSGCCFSNSEAPSSKIRKEIAGGFEGEKDEERGFIRDETHEAIVQNRDGTNTLPRDADLSTSRISAKVANQDNSSLLRRRGRREA